MNKKIFIIGIAALLFFITPLASCSCSNDTNNDNNSISYDSSHSSSSYSSSSKGDSSSTSQSSSTSENINSSSISSKDKVSDSSEHIHTYSSSWTSDETSHYHASTCGHDVKKDEEVHSYTDWEIIEYSTTTTKGKERRSCNVCGYTEYRDMELIPTYTITLDFNGGTSKTYPNTTSKVYETYYLSKDDFVFDLTKEGYKFRGWTYNGKVIFDENGNLINDVTIDKPMTFTALFGDKVQLDITLNMEEACKVSGAGQYALNTYVDLEAYPNEGYKFVGWYYDDLIISNSYTYKYMLLDEDVTLEARFELDTFTLSIYSNNEYYGLVMPKSSTITTYEKSYNVDYKYTDKVTIEAYTSSNARFLGWYDKNNNLVSTDAVYTFTMPSHDYTLEAKWNHFKINYNLNGGEFDVESDDIQDYYTLESVPTLSTPTKEGYTFVGWKYNGEFVTEIDSNWMKDITLEAVWETIDYTITYELDGGTIENSPITYTVEDEINIPNPTKTGYTFLGWTSEIEATPTVDYVIKKGTIENISLTANWKINTYEVTFVDYDGTVISSTTLEYDTTPTMPSDPTRVADETYTYTFTGWTPEVDKVTKDITYTATYEETYIDYQLTIIINDGSEVVESLHYNDNIVDKINITREGYTFGGLFTDEALTNEITTMPSSDITVYVWWKEETKPANFTYSEDNNYITITKYVGNEANVVIPSYIANKEVTTIGGKTFKNCTDLATVTIGNGVTSIGSSAFYNCSSLTSIIIPDSLTSIRSYAFYDCTNLTTIYYKGIIEDWINISASEYCARPNYNNNFKNFYILDENGTIEYNGNKYSLLTELVIPEGVKTIGSYTFSHLTSITSVTIPDSVTSIGSYAFRNCTNLTSIVIPNSVTSIGSNAFEGCYSLVEVINKSSLNITKGSSVNGYIGYYALNIKTSGTSDIVNKDGYLFYTYDNVNYLIKYVGNDTSLVLPSDYNGETYEIYKYAFYNNSNITNVIIPDSVTSIGSNTFYYCKNLTSVTIGNGVTSIGSSAFYNCSSLTSIIIPDSLTSIRSYAFYDCTNLTTIYYKGIIEDWINISASEYCARPNYNNNFKNFYILDENGTIEYNGNKYSLLTELVIPEGVTTIGSYTFFHLTSITSVTIGNGVTTIGERAFYYCTSLTSIVIPDSVTSIGEYAFDECTSLQYNEYDNGYYLGNEDNPYLVLVKAKSTDITSCKINENCMFIHSLAFYYCKNLTSVTIGNGVTSIGSSAFSYCSSLTSIVIPDSVTSIGSSAFSYCSSLTSIVIPDSVTSIGSNAFECCYSLVEVINKSSLNITKGSSDNGYIGYYALNIKTSGTSDIVNKDGYLFYTYDNVNYLIKYVGNDTSLVLPSDYNGETYEIYKYAFYNNSNITNVIIPDSVTSIGSNTFYYCKNLTSVTIGNGVTSIGSSAFYNCSSLTSIIIPDSLTSIRSYAFYDCTNLTTIYYKGIIEDWINISASEYCARPNYNNNFKNFYILDENGTIEYNGNKYSLLTELVIPEGVKTIGSYTFSHLTSITSVTIPDSVTSIGSYAFRNCTNLTSIVIPNSVTSIGSNAFEGCYSLVEVINKSSLNITKGSSVNGYIGYYALNIKTSGTSDIVNKDGYLFYTYDNVNYLIKYVGNDTSLVLPSDYNGETYEIYKYAFYNNSNITNVIIPDSVTSIGSNTFYYCKNLTSVTIGNGVTSIGSSAFSNCSSLTSIVIPDSVTSIGSFAFQSCTSLTNIVIPDSVTSIGFFAFYNCSSLTSIIIPDSVTSIGSYAFRSCTNLTNIVIPDSVTSIGSFAFQSCTSLTSIVIPDSVTSIGSNAFECCYSLVEVINKSSLNITKGSSDNGYIGYYALNIKTSGTSDIVNKDGYLFYTYDNVNYLIKYVGNDTSLVLPSDYNGETYEIYKYAFNNNSNITNVIIPDSVTSIGSSAFSYCSSLTSIVIPDSVTSIGSFAFQSCTSLTNIVIPDSVTTIGERAFYYCTSLTSIVIPDSVTSIGEYAFDECTSLQYNEYDNGYYLGNEDNPYLVLVKAKSTDITSCKINENCMFIHSLAFYYCKNLTSVTIGNGVTSIGSSAFSYCISLTSIYYNGTYTEWNNINISSGNSSLTSATMYFYYKD